MAIAPDSHKGQEQVPSLPQCSTAILPSWHPVVSRGHQVPLSVFCCLTGRGHTGSTEALLPPLSSAWACHCLCWCSAGHGICRGLASCLGDTRCCVPEQSSKESREFSWFWERKPWQFLETGSRETSLTHAVLLRTANIASPCRRQGLPEPLQPPFPVRESISFFRWASGTGFYNKTRQRRLGGPWLGTEKRWAGVDEAEGDSL